MSKSYLDLTETNFPQEIDTFDRVTDVTIDLLPLVKEYQTLYNSGKLNEASQILINHPELQNCMINAKTINRCYDGIKALQRYYFSDIQKYIEELITYRGDYSNKNSYEKYDVILHNSSAYLCISDSSIGTPVTDKDHFVQITLRGEQGEAGLGLHFSGTWSPTINYAKNAAVTYNTSLYASLVDDNLSHTPSSTTNNYWSEIINFSNVTSFDNSSVGTTTETTMQGALEELYSLSKTNKTNINTNASNITINTNKITDINNRISNINNTADKDKEVKYAINANYATSATNANYATSAGSATTSSTCTGNSATSNYANSAGNSDTVDGFHFQLSTTDLQAGTSPLTTNVFYFVYE